MFLDERFTKIIKDRINPHDITRNALILTCQDLIHETKKELLDKANNIEGTEIYVNETDVERIKKSWGLTLKFLKVDILSMYLI
jgi:hypothetical protein